MDDVEVEREALRRRLVEAVEQACCPDPREALIGTRQLELALEEVLVRAVRQARAGGYGWAPMGRLLGRSRQAMRQRFGPLVPDPAPRVSRRERIERHRWYVYRSLRALGGPVEPGSDGADGSWGSAGSG